MNVDVAFTGAGVVWAGAESISAAGQPATRRVDVFWTDEETFRRLHRPDEGDLLGD